MSAKLWLGILLLASAGGIGAATTPAAAWVMLPDTGLDFAYVRLGAEIGNYDSVVISPLSVWYEPGSADGKRVRELQQRFSQLFGNTLARQDLPVIANAGGTTLRLHVELIDLSDATPDPVLDTWAQRLRFDVAAGRMTVVGELQDAETNRVLLRFADLHDDNLPATTTKDPADAAFVTWAEKLATTLTELTTGKPKQHLAQSPRPPTASP